MALAPQSLTVEAKGDLRHGTITDSFVAYLPNDSPKVLAAAKAVSPYVRRAVGLSSSWQGRPYFTSKKNKKDIIMHPSMRMAMKTAEGGVEGVLESNSSLTLEPFTPPSASVMRAQEQLQELCGASFRTVEASFNRSFNDSMLASICSKTEGGAGIEVLDVDCCAVTDEGLVNLVREKKLLQLQKLSLRAMNFSASSDCSGIKDDSLPNLVSVSLFDIKGPQLLLNLINQSEAKLRHFVARDMSNQVEITKVLEGNLSTLEDLTLVDAGTIDGTMLTKIPNLQSLSIDHDMMTSVGKAEGTLDKVSKLALVGVKLDSANAFDDVTTLIRTRFPRVSNVVCKGCQTVAGRSLAEALVSSGMTATEEPVEE